MSNVGKTSPNKIEQGNSAEAAHSETLKAVRLSVTAAAEQLKSMGGNYERVGWLLEDALVYLEPSEQFDSEEHETFNLEKLLSPRDEMGDFDPDDILQKEERSTNSRSS